jgi:autotransporter-associated beta strand protein
MNKNYSSPRIKQVAFATFTSLLALQSAHAVSQYWDSNDTTAGAGLDPTGTWGTSTFWSTSSDGTGATANTATTTADDLFFSAGSDTTGAYTVTVDGTQEGQSITAQTGDLTLTGGTVALANSGSSSGALWKTTGTANMTVDSNILVDSSTDGYNFLNFSPDAGTSITFNGTVSATDATNNLYIRQNGAGTVIFNTDLGSDANFQSGLQLGNIDGAEGTLTLNGNQSLGTTQVGIYFKTGTLNFGDTVDTGNAVSIGVLKIGETALGATLNINSAVDMNGSQLTLYSGTTNVSGSLTTTGNSFFGYTGGTTDDGSMNINNGGEATLGNVYVRGNFELTNAGTLTAGILTMGADSGITINTDAKHIIGDATGTGSTTVNSLVSAGTGTLEIVGGNSANSTLTVNSNVESTFDGVIGGTDTNENNITLIKGGSSILNLGGDNTFTGGTMINSGTLNITENGSFAFEIGADGVNNAIEGIGILNVDGDFIFDLSGAAANGSWTIVESSLTESFGETFEVVGFTDDGNDIWSKVVGGSIYTFDESTGILTAIPEPATWALILGMGAFFMVARRRRS